MMQESHRPWLNFIVENSDRSSNEVTAFLEGRKNDPVLSQVITCLSKGNTTKARKLLNPELAAKQEAEEIKKREAEQEAA